MPMSMPKRPRHLATILLPTMALLLLAARAPAAGPGLEVGDVRIFPYNFTPSGFYACDGRALNIGENEPLFNVIENRFGEGEKDVTFKTPKLPGLYSGMAKGFEDITACQQKAKAMAEEFRVVAVKTRENIIKAEDAVMVFNRINQFPSLAAEAPQPGPRQKVADRVIAAIDFQIKTLEGAIAKPLGKEFDAVAMSMAEETIRGAAADREKLAVALKDLPVLMDALVDPKGLIANKRTAEQLAQLAATRIKAGEAKAGIQECSVLLDVLEAEFRVSPVGAIVKISKCISWEAAKQDPYVGEIRLLAFNFDPKGWAPCDGRLLEMTKNTELFVLLGTKFGGDGTKTFALPLVTGPDPKSGNQLQYYIALRGTFPPRD